MVRHRSLSRYHFAPCQMLELIVIRRTFYCRLGRLRPKDVPEVLDIITEQPLCTDVACASLTAHWRGRMGLPKEEQLERYRLATR